MRKQIEKMLTDAFANSALREAGMKKVVWEYLFKEKILSVNDVSIVTEKVICGNYADLNDTDIQALIQKLEASKHE